jgi:hypothetical protein
MTLATVSQRGLLGWRDLQSVMEPLNMSLVPVAGVPGDSAVGERWQRLLQPRIRDESPVNDTIADSTRVLRPNRMIPRNGITASRIIVEPN